MREYDVVIIGSGSGGVACALRCADNGKLVLLIDKRDKDGPGGTCINRGCIPTKALMRSVRALEDIKNSRKYGIEVPEYIVNFQRVMAAKNKILQQMVFSLKQFVIGSRDNIELRLNTTSEITSPKTVKLICGNDTEEVFVRDGIVIATGSEPAMIPVFNIDKRNVITSDQALTLKEAPKSMLVIGAGAIGMEMSTFYNAMGTKITMVEMMGSVVPLLNDKQITDLIHVHLEKEGITVKTGVGVNRIDILEEGRVRSYLSNGEMIETEKVLVGIGRKSNIDGIGLENLKGIVIDRDKIQTNAYQETSVKGIFAVGDITNGPQLSHKAQNEGVAVAENLCNNPMTLDYGVLPWIIFSMPEIAKVGLSEQDAKDKGINVLTGLVEMSANEKAITMQETTGAIKITIDKKTRKIIGAALFCAEASSLIGELAMCVKKGTTVEELASTIHAHPTLTEAVMESAKKALGIAYHK
jgi:dihydrolipoamide dehydrogenase